MKKIFSYIFFIFVISNSFSQNFTIFSEVEFNRIKKTLFNNAVYVESYLPSNYSKDGTIDYTKYVQFVLDRFDVVVMPDIPVLINENGLNINTNQKILFQQNSKLVLKPNNRDRYGILNLFNVSNVDIYYPQLVGDKDDHLSNTGQWGMGIYILSSKNINIHTPRIENCWGDGICIGGRNNISSKNINIRKAIITNNRRNGITIGAVDNLTIESAYIANTSGYNPQAGIDIEPDNNGFEIKNVYLENIKTINNGYYGIVISPGNLVGNKKKVISIYINNFIDIGSPIGLGLGITREKKESNSLPLKGNIIVRNFKSYNNKICRIRGFRGIKHFVKVNLDYSDLNLSQSEIDYYNKKILSNEAFILK